MKASPPSTGTGEPAENAPVNIAAPNWACPHCGTAYRQDLDAATACAQAGPASDTVEDAPVLMLTGVATASRGLRIGVGAPVLGLTEVGPVQPVTVDGRRAHRRDVVVAGKQIDPTRLAEARHGHDGLRILTSTRSPGRTEMSGLSSLNPVTKMFVGNRYASYEPSPVAVWIDESRNALRDGEAAWWHIPDAGQRAALNLVTNGLLDQVCATSEDDLTAAIRAAYVPNGRSRRQSVRPEDLAGPNGGLIIAAAHGAPNHIWALRWLTAHLDEVAAWQSRTLRAWAAGKPEQTTGEPDTADEQVVLMPAVGYLRTSDTLPKNPGKRRLAVMEPYGDDYRIVRDVIVRQLAADDPTNPVPGIADVTTTIRATSTGGRTTTQPTPEGN